MFLYIFKSKLFQGMEQKRVVILSFPINDKSLLERLVNYDNNYSEDDKWLLREVVSW